MSRENNQQTLAVAGTATLYANPYYGKSAMLQGCV